MNKFESLLHGFLQSVDYSKLRLTNLPNFIFLCGGSTLKNDAGKYCSMRGAILEEIYSYPKLREKIHFAEDYTDWLEHGVVSNLIDFELAIADMAAAIVLILEGPGAFAELGSFSVLDALSDKMILVVNDSLVADNSFINLGPIKYLEDNDKIILRYNWSIEFLVRGPERNIIETVLSLSNDKAQEKARTIIDKISTKVDGMSLLSPLLDNQKIGHACFIVADLIYLFGALRLHEITECLKDYFEVKNSSVSLVRTCLYILTIFGFVKEVRNGDRYYIATSLNQGFIKYYYDTPLYDLTKCSNKNDVMAQVYGECVESDKARFEVMAGY